MKNIGGKTQPTAKINTTSTSGEEVPEEEQKQEHETEDPGEEWIEHAIVEPDIPSLLRPRKGQYSNVV